MQIISFKPLQHKQVEAVLPSRPRLLTGHPRGPGCHLAAAGLYTHADVPVAMETEVVAALRCKWG